MEPPMRLISLPFYAFSTLSLTSAALGYAGESGPCTYPLKPAPCNADIDSSGAVGVDDLLMIVDQWGATGDNERPTGDCAPLNNGDCQVNITDLLMVLDQFGSDTSACGPCGIGEILDCQGNCAPAYYVGDTYCDDGSWTYNGNQIYFNCPEFDCDGGDCDTQNCTGDMITGSCWLPSNTCSVLYEFDCELAGGVSWLVGANCEDTDGDRIPDVYELGDCSTPTGGFTGTDPNNSDTDGDSIDDGDEVFGTLAGLDLPGYGCNPCRKDILIQVDWTNAAAEDNDYNKLHPNQAARVVAAFANAPLSNPDGSTGITLHIDLGQAPYLGGQYVTDPNGDGNIEVDNVIGLSGGELPIMRANSLAANRDGYFHYAIMANSLSWVGEDPLGWSGYGDLPGENFIVTMGSWPAIGDEDRIGSTFMHELGHNLDLKHGGATHSPNYKANFNSVMNYRFQLCGTDLDSDSLPDGGLDYSRNMNDDLNESLLDESAGLHAAGPAIDWNGNGAIDAGLISFNINCRPNGCNGLRSYGCNVNPPTQCGDIICTSYTDNNDWNQVKFSGITMLTIPTGIGCNPMGFTTDTDNE